MIFKWYYNDIINDIIMITIWFFKIYRNDTVMIVLMIPSWHYYDIKIVKLISNMISDDIIVQYHKNIEKVSLRLL